jgi:uncharacterized membrane protein
MAKSMQVMAAVYPTLDQAKTILEMLQQMHKAGRITLADAAILSKEADGKVRVNETAELTTKEGAVRGALITGVIGLIWPPSLIGSLLVGAGLGGLVGKVRDTGIKNAQLTELADRLEPGKAMVVALAGEESEKPITGALQGYEGTLVTQSIGAKAIEEISSATASG